MKNEIVIYDELGNIEKDECLIVPLFTSQSLADALQTAGFAELPKLWIESGRWNQNPSCAGFAGQIIQAAMSDSGRTVELIAVGLGQREESGNYAMLMAGLALGQKMPEAGTFAVAMGHLGHVSDGALRALVEGIYMGRFKANPLHSENDEQLRLRIVLPTDNETRNGLTLAAKIGMVSARHANWVRQLVEMPPAELRPRVFADIIANRARTLGVGAKVWTEGAMAEHGFGGTLAVGAGSDSPPAVVVLETERRSDRQPLGLAGKGVTFDSGGINLKRDRSEIAYMKSDMAGAAAVAGAVFAALELGLTPDVVAVLPMAENMPSGSAMRPGDIVTHPNGMRTEVVDTDCEGRLLLADALAWLDKQETCGMVDVGTLTDGGGVGPLLWGFWSNDDELSSSLCSAGDAVSDPGWRLPLREEYKQMLASRVADLANAPSWGIPDIGLTAATYLSQFVGKTPWVHIDNGSIAYLTDRIGAWPEGATASPMRALLQLLVERA